MQMWRNRLPLGEGPAADDPPGRVDPADPHAAPRRASPGLMVGLTSVGAGLDRRRRACSCSTRGSRPRRWSARTSPRRSRSSRRPRSGTCCSGASRWRSRRRCSWARSRGRSSARTISSRAPGGVIRRVLAVVLLASSLKLLGVPDVASSASPRSPPSLFAFVGWRFVRDRIKRIPAGRDARPDPCRTSGRVASRRTIACRSATPTAHDRQARAGGPRRRLASPPPRRPRRRRPRSARARAGRLAAGVGDGGPTGARRGARAHRRREHAAGAGPAGSTGARPPMSCRCRRSRAAPDRTGTRRSACRRARCATGSAGPATASSAVVVDELPARTDVDAGRRGDAARRPAVVVVGPGRDGGAGPPGDVGWAGLTRAAWAAADAVDAGRRRTGRVVRLAIPWPRSAPPDLSAGGVGTVRRIARRPTGRRGGGDRGGRRRRTSSSTLLYPPASARRARGAARRRGRRARARSCSSPACPARASRRSPARSPTSSPTRGRGASRCSTATRSASTSRGASASTPNRARSTSTGSPGWRRWSPSTAASRSPRRSPRSTPAAATPGRWRRATARSCSCGSTRRSPCARPGTGRGSTRAPARVRSRSSRGSRRPTSRRRDAEVVIDTTQVDVPEAVRRIREALDAKLAAI